MKFDYRAGVMSQLKNILGFDPLSEKGLNVKDRILSELLMCKPDIRALSNQSVYLYLVGLSRILSTPSRFGMDFIHTYYDTTQM